MISDRSNFRAQIQRLFVIVIRKSYRWICNNLFLLGVAAFLYLLHRTCPLLFSSLVAASPVLVCTFVLLGTILSFGESNIPEIEKEPETVHEAAPFRTEVSRDATVVESGDKSFTVERFVSTEKDVLEDGNKGADKLGENQLSEVEDEGQSFDYRPLVDEIKRDTHVRFEEKAFVSELEKRGEKAEEKLIENDGMQVSDAEKSRKNGAFSYEMLDDSKEDQMVVSPISPWRPMRHEEDEDDDGDRDDSLDSGSDGAESSSPDASMTDIIPMLDELHPLLLSETPTRGFADGEGSDAASEGLHRSSSDEGMDSDVDSDSPGEEGDNEEEEEDEEEKVEKKKDKDDESKSAIKWTEADQKNVMDLGSLELERNQRLENLIARRRARHSMRLMAERNLIDFDSANIPINMPPISTARQNPFDLPYDSYDDLGLPPIPGSAPSIMFARRNPFDIPYEPNEEKPDLKGEGFQEEFSSQQPKDPVFRRHESFSVGPSMLGGSRHDRLRPFFVLERLENEGTSQYPFERQLSEISESKVSSVPDTESVCTMLEDDEKKVDEHDTDRETEIHKVDMASDHDKERHHLSSDQDEEKSHSASEDSDSDGQTDSRNLHHDVAEIRLGSAETHHEQSDMIEGETSDKGNHEEEDSSDSDSSLSEKEEKMPDFTGNESVLISEQKVDLHQEPGTSSQHSFGDLGIHVTRGVEDDYHHDEVHAEDPFITSHPSLEGSSINDLCGLVDGHHEEPVYDSSPSGSRFPSFSSVSSDYKPDISQKNVEVQENADKESEVEVVSTGMVEQHLPTATLEESPDVVHDTAETSVNRSIAEGHKQEEEEARNQKDEASRQTFNTNIPIDSYSTLSSGAVEYVETHSFNEDVVPRFEQDPVQSSVSDTEEGTQSNQTMDIEVDSVNANGQVVRSEETNPSESDRVLTWSDKSVVEQSSLEASEDQVPTRAGPLSVVFSRNITFHEYHDAPEDAAELSSLTSDTSSSPAESPDYTTPMVGEGSRADFFQEELDHVVERSDQLTDLHAISQNPPEVISEELDEIKEIDEGLLSELDTIGDFSVKEIVTDSEPGPSSLGLDVANELTEALPVLEERSVRDIESDFHQIHEGSEVEDVIHSSTVQSQLSQENYGNSTETKSDIPVVEATSNEDTNTARDQAVKSIGKQPKSPESDGGSGEIKRAVETKPSESLVEERSLDETDVHLNNTPEKREEVEIRSEVIPTSDVSSIETRSLEEIPEPSELREEMEIISERAVIPTESIGSSNVTPSDEVVAAVAKAETTSNTDSKVQSPESKESLENSGENMAEQKGKMKKKGTSNSSSSSSSSSDSD